MDKQEQLCIQRFIDLSKQAQNKGVVLFSDFLNMNEINLLYQSEKELYASFSLFGGYQLAERQVVAFLPDALYYNWDYPICCLHITPINKKFSDQIGHRDVLGSLMNLGIERSMIGDIVIHDLDIYVYVLNKISDYIMQELSRIKHTVVCCQMIEVEDMDSNIQYEEAEGQIASNRLDAFVALACKYSRKNASEYIINQNVSINGRLITNHNQGINSGDIISLRGFGKLQIIDFVGTTRKGKLIIKYSWYK